MANLDEVVFIDVSRWQGVMNWEVAKSKIHFAYMKATEGTAGLDVQYARNRAECDRLHIPWGAYHFFKADKDPKRQAEFFASQIGRVVDGVYKFDSIMRPVLDVEMRPSGYTKQMMFDAVSKFLIKYNTITGAFPVIYTSKNFWDNNLPRTDFDNTCWLWTANWNKYIEEPLIPLDWENRGWKMWQWSADGNGRGAEFGAQSTSIDVNRYKGGLAALRADYPGINWQPLPTQPPPGGGKMITVPVYKVSNANGLNVRSAADVTASIWFTLPQGAEVEAVEEIVQGSNVWVRVGQRQYCAKVYNGVTYLVPA